LAVYRDEDGRIVAPRLAVGGAETYARRIAEAEQVLAGRAPLADSFAAAADRAADAIDPMEDAQTSGEYRRDLVRTVMRRALEQSLL
jgi:carbon-monoxide dehydrogenase medium subunit